MELAETATLFHTAAGDGFADVDVSGHRETHKMRSKAFKSWLTHQYYMTTKGAPNSDAMQSALNVLEARAHFEGVEREVHLRVVESMQERSMSTSQIRSGVSLKSAPMAGGSFRRRRCGSGERKECCRSLNPSAAVQSMRCARSSTSRTMPTLCWWLLGCSPP